MNTKQVIVVRHDLIKGEHAVRRGKMMAQVAHASIGALLKLFKKEKCITQDGAFLEKDQEYYRYEVEFGPNTVLDDWLNGKFTKIVVSVPGEAELLELKEKIDKSDHYIPSALITDCGLTEFHGQPTVTCLGLGPCESNVLDEFTKDLPLI